jgi:hypothetical protein
MSRRAQDAVLNASGQHRVLHLDVLGLQPRLEHVFNASGRYRVPPRRGLNRFEPAR